MENKLEKYDASRMDLEMWLELLSIQFLLKEVTTNEKKVLTLLSLLSIDTYTSLSSWCAPKQPMELKFEDLTGILKERYCKKRMLITYRHELLQEKQKPGQSLEEFYRSLEQLAGKCAFDKVKDVKDCILTMQFIRGMSDDVVRKRLLAEEEVEGIKALQLAQKVEIAERSSDQLAGRQDYTIHQQHQERRSQPTSRNGQHNDRQQSRNCFVCGKFGHFARECPSPKQPNNQFKNRRNNFQGKRQHQINPEVELDSIVVVPTEAKAFAIKSRDYQFQPPMMLPVVLQGKEVQMELDTGAAVSIIDESTWKRIGRPNLRMVEYGARSYTGGKITFKGLCTVDMRVGDVRQEAKLHVLQTGSPIFGRDLQSQVGIGLNVLQDLANQGFSVNELRKTDDVSQGNPQTKDPSEKVSALIKKYPAVFSDGLGRCTKLQAKLHMDEGSFRSRKFYRARPVPHALKDQVSSNLEEMVRDGITEQVTHSEWAAPIAIVPKPNGKIRLCGDYRVAVNKCLQVDQYPIPRINELFHSLNRGEHYSKLDLEKAYNQIELDEESKKYTTISTHMGLFRYNRLPFGVANAPAIFQHLMDRMLHGIENVIVYLDDIVVTGRTQEEHLRTLEKVFKRLEEHGLKVKKEKCEFFKDQIEVLGHVLSREGIHKLRRKDVTFQWGEEQDTAFREIKERMQETDVLTHFDPTKPVVLATDASEYGLGAVLYHQMEDGTEKVIEYASRAMTTTEQKYAQIEKEALGIVWGMDKFQTYLFGLKFKLRTDHQPLLKILGPKAEMPILAAKRLHKWALKIAQFTFSIEYVPTAEFGNADGLSRLVDPTEQITDYLVSEEFQVKSVKEEYFQGTPFNKEIVLKAIEEDKVLCDVRKYIRTQWPPNIHPTDDYLYKLGRVRDELHVQDGIVLKENRIVIPAGLRKMVIDMLHKGHPGMSRMKELARGKVWYPMIDVDIENRVRGCEDCQSQARKPQKTLTNLWPEPNKVWQRIHLDFAGPVHGYHWLILVDAKSKWVQVSRMSRITSQDVIAELEKTFTIYGLVEQIVTDNGRQFTSHEYRTYCKDRGIQVTYSPPYHPQSNGAAERVVQTFKKVMAKELGRGDVNVEVALRKFLASYRHTPHSTTGVSPAELMFGRPARTIFDLNWDEKLLAPVQMLEKERKVDSGHITTMAQQKNHSFRAREQMKKNFNKRAKEVEYSVGDIVYAENFRGSPQWIPGKIVSKMGHVMYTVHTTKGDWVRHANQLRRRYPEWIVWDDDQVDVPVKTGDDLLTSTTQRSSPCTSTTQFVTSTEQKDDPPLRRSTRKTQQPDRYSPPVPLRRK